MTNNICFATMAVREEYRKLATLLAQDLSTYCNNVTLVVLTDDPEYFTESSNVTAYHHTPTGNWYCYHDKRLVVAKALSLYNTCIFVDADCRLLNTPPLNDISKLKQGIYGYDVSNLEEKINREERNTKLSKTDLSNTPSRRKKLHSEISNLTSINYAATKYIQESFMIFVKDKQLRNYDMFFSAWFYMAGYLRVRRYEWGVGETIGLAANLAGLEIQQFTNVPSWLLKDLYKGHSLSEASAGDEERILKLLDTRNNVANNNKKSLIKKLIYHSKAIITYIVFYIGWVINNKRYLSKLNK